MKIIKEETAKLLKDIRKETTRLEFEAMETTASSMDEIHKHLASCAIQLSALSFDLYGD